MWGYECKVTGNIVKDVASRVADREVRVWWCVGGLVGCVCVCLSVGQDVCSCGGDGVCAWCACCVLRPRAAINAP